MLIGNWGRRKSNSLKLIGIGLGIAWQVKTASLSLAKPGRLPRSDSQAAIEAGEGFARQASGFKDLVSRACEGLRDVAM